MAAVLPFPLVPAIWMTNGLRWGSPSRARSVSTRRRSKWAAAIARPPHPPRRAPRHREVVVHHTEGLEAGDRVLDVPPSALGLAPTLPQQPTRQKKAGLPGTTTVLARERQSGLEVFLRLRPTVRGEEAIRLRKKPARLALDQHCRRPLSKLMLRYGSSRERGLHLTEAGVRHGLVDAAY